MVAIYYKLKFNYLLFCRRERGMMLTSQSSTTNSLALGTQWVLSSTAVLIIIYILA